MTPKQGRRPVLVQSRSMRQAKQTVLAASELVADVRGLKQRIAAVEARIKAAVAQVNTSLLGLFGVGPVQGATFMGEVGDIGRFPTKHHFAAHTGSAPLEASSGQVIGHRPGTASSIPPCT